MLIAASILAWTLLASEAEAARPSERVAVLVGNNDGGADRSALSYAERDAIEVQRVLESLGGVKRTRLLLGQGPAALRQTLQALAEEAARQHDPSPLFFYYSGHADAQGILMGEGRFEFQELRASLEAFPAPLFVAIIDACQSGRVTRSKGGIPVPVLDLALREDGEAYRGSVFITSGAEDEAAQESDDVLGSFFTHFLVAGLRGAADDSGDRRVSLEEAYRFAYRHTVERTRGTILGPQHPSYDVDLRGQGQLVLTWLTSERGYLLLPAEAEGRYQLRRDDGSAALGELTKNQGKSLRIALEPGRYEITRRGSSNDWVQSVAIGQRGEWRLDDARMVARPHERHPSKGGAGATSIALGYHLGLGFLTDATPNHSLRATVLIPLGGLALGGYVLAGAADYPRADAVQVALRELGGGAVLDLPLLRLGPVEVLAGAEGGLIWVWQRGSAGASRAETLTAPIVALAARLGVAVELNRHWAVVARSMAGGNILRAALGLEVEPLVAGELGLRLTP